MAAFTVAETAACQQVIALALTEDLGLVGDLTSEAIIPLALDGQAIYVARTPGVLAGLPAAELVFQTLEKRGLSARFEPLLSDGSKIDRGTAVARVSGSMRAILAAERTSLNFLQHLCGIATLTRRYADLIADLPCRLLDTRKTTPGWRLLEKYAVRCGGGHNHRLGLFDAVLIKDNHLAALARSGLGHGSLVEAVTLARVKHGHAVPLEIEVDTLEQLEVALPARPDIVLLDNMSLEQLRQAVQRRNAVAPTVLLEASGGVNLSTLRGIAETGVDRVSVGALTHSAVALDLGLDYQTP